MEIEGEVGDEKIGVQARLMSRSLRKLTPSVAKSDTLLIFINQIRHKIGVLFGSPETTSGGQALKFYSSVRLDVRKKDIIKNSQGENIGTSHKVKVVKNKVAPPFRVAEFSMRFGKGVNRYGEVIDVAITHGLVQTKGAWYYVTHPDFLTEDGSKLPLGQGREKAIALLEQDPQLFKRLSETLRSMRLSKSSFVEGDESQAAKTVSADEVEMEESLSNDIKQQ